jgi:preprotein translocase subunit SecF
MKVIQFLKHRFVFIVLSSVFIVGGIAVTAVRGGFNLGLDFQAGLSRHVVIDTSGAKAPIDQVRTALRGIEGNQIQVIGSPADQEYSIKVKQQGDDKTFSENIAKRINDALGNAFGAGNVKVLQSEYVGPRFSADLASQAAFLTIFALVLILLYSWFRFKLAYAVAAIVATLHDTLFMIGVIGAFRLEVSTATIAAVLTIIGYSLNDTIVIFDRIRENTKLMRESPFPVVINTSLTQSLSRTLITSLTTLIAVLAIYIFGTGEVQQFALNMIVGVTVGTYSSIFIASPVLLGWRNAADRRLKMREAKRAGIAYDPKSEVKKTEEKISALKATAQAPVPAESIVQSSAAPAAPEAEADEDTDGEDDGIASKSQPGRVRLSREQRKRKAKKGA